MQLNMKLYGLIVSSSMIPDLFICLLMCYLMCIWDDLYRSSRLRKGYMLVLESCRLESGIEGVKEGGDSY